MAYELVWLFVTRVRKLCSESLKARHLVITSFAYTQAFDRCVYGWEEELSFEGSRDLPRLTTMEAVFGHFYVQVASMNFWLIHGMLTSFCICFTNFVETLFIH